MKILVVSPYRGIGDLIFHLPLFRYLNKKYKTKINLITVHNSKAKYILKRESYISKIVYGDFNRQQIFNKIVKLKNEINKFKSDLTIVSASSKRLVASLILSNSKEKIYFLKSSKKDLSKYIYKETKRIFNLSNLDKNYQLNLSKNIKKEKKNVFLNIDSFHNHNNWGENNYLNLILELLKKKCKLFVNFSPKHKKKFKKIIFIFKNKKNIEFTYNKNFKEILKIIQNSNYVIGNESGPICIGASLRKKVISIYNPKTTPRSSKTIYKKVIFINAKSVKYDLIKKKIINFIK